MCFQGKTIHLKSVLGEGLSRQGISMSPWIFITSETKIWMETAPEHMSLRLSHLCDKGKACVKQGLPLCTLLMLWVLPILDASVQLNHSPVGDWLESFCINFGCLFGRLKDPLYLPNVNVLHLFSSRFANAMRDGIHIFCCLLNLHGAIAPHATINRSNNCEVHLDIFEKMIPLCRLQVIPCLEYVSIAPAAICFAPQSPRQQAPSCNNRPEGHFS